MKKHEIEVGAFYIAKVNGNLVTVRVNAIRVGGFTRGASQTAYDVTNLKTGRQTTFRSAAKFRRPARGANPKPAIVCQTGDETDPLRPEEGEQGLGPYCGGPCECQDKPIDQPCHYGDPDEPWCKAIADQHAQEQETNP